MNCISTELLLILKDSSELAYVRVFFVASSISANVYLSTIEKALRGDSERNVPFPMEMIFRHQCLSRTNFHYEKNVG
jgi:hypothetical protein